MCQRLDWRKKENYLFFFKQKVLERINDKVLHYISTKSDSIFHVGKQKLMHFSEGVKESLRRLSNVIWMAEELHRVADFLLPNISVSTHSCTKL